MAGPLYITRSYGGGAQVAQLVSEVGASDTSFAISPTTGWTDQNGNALGTTGPFTVVIDRFTASVEKILCSGINLATGVVSVYTASGFSGRGYDGTNPVAHVPGGSSSGVQTCWTAEEAYEANIMVASVLGGNPPPSAGQVLTFNGTVPAWTTVAAVHNPAGRIHLQLSEVITGSTWTIVTGMNTGTPDFLAGGMTAASNGLVAPVTGVYSVRGQVRTNSNASFTSLGAGYFVNNVFTNGVNPTYGNPLTQAGLSVNFSDLVSLTAADTVNLGGYAAPGNAATANDITTMTFLALALVSS